MVGATVAPVPEPTLSDLLRPSFDRITTPVVALVVALAAGLYVLGVRRLGAKGRRWPAGRSSAAGGALAVIVFATQTGVDRYSTTLFTAHMVQHVLLGMVAPLLLALAAPVTLALQASGRTTQTTLLGLLQRRPVAVLTHPVAGWILFGGTLVALYYTALFELSLRNEVVHSMVHVHLLAVGSIFVWPLVGADPVRGRLPHGARLLAVLLAVPFHAFVGIALLGAEELLAGGFYAEAGRDWGPSVLEDQRSAAGILWASGDVFGLVLAAVVFVGWVAADERAARRADRLLDAAATAGDTPGREVERNPS